MFNNKQIEAGAEAIAGDLALPGGGRKKLARVVENHLNWFDAAEARGLTWGDMSRLLLAAGAKGRNGRAISIGTLSSTVWRKRKEPLAARNPLRTPTRIRIAMGQRGKTEESGSRTAASGTASKNDAADYSAKIREQGRSVAEPTPLTAQNAAKPETRVAIRSETAPLALKTKTLAFMKRAATIRRGSTK